MMSPGRGERGKTQVLIKTHVVDGRLEFEDFRYPRCLAQRARQGRLLITVVCGVVSLLQKQITDPASLYWSPQELSPAAPDQCTVGSLHACAHVIDVTAIVPI